MTIVSKLTDIVIPINIKHYAAGALMMTMTLSVNQVHQVNMKKTRDHMALTQAMMKDILQVDLGLNTPKLISLEKMRNMKRLTIYFRTKNRCSWKWRKGKYIKLFINTLKITQSKNH